MSETNYLWYLLRSKVHRVYYIAGMHRNIFGIANMTLFYTHVMQNCPNKPFPLKIFELRIHGISKRHIFYHFWHIKFDSGLLFSRASPWISARVFLLLLFSRTFSLDFSGISAIASANISHGVPLGMSTKGFFSSEIYLEVLSGFQSFLGS